MLSPEENELISRVGPGTLMGNLMRQYWVPAMLSSEVPSPDCDPVRVLLLGEKLLGFRDSRGQVGLIAHSCPHRGASLWFGRNEECGLRCVYHGWKFDVTGACVDMPNEPAESNFKDKIKATAYPCRERAGIVWAYLGQPRDPLPPLPDLEGNMVEGASAAATQMEWNYVTVAEGSLDTSHASILHFGGLSADDEPAGTFAELMLRNRAPRYEVTWTPGGVVYGAYRDAGNGQRYWRVAHFLLPFYTMNPTGLLGDGAQNTVARVPMDDTHTMSFSLNSGPVRGGQRDLLPNTTDWYGRFRPVANPSNDFLIDRDVQRRNQGPDGWTGIHGVNRQDQAVQASMGPLYDRSREHLGSSDSMVIQTRRRLLDAARRFAQTGETPDGVDHPEHYRVRSGGVLLPADADWMESTRELQRAFVEHPDLDQSLMRGTAR